MISLGVDLGQVRDRTVIIGVQSFEVAAPEAPEEELPGRRARPQRHFDMVHIETLRPGTPYPVQARLISAAAEGLAGEELPQLFVDATAVGRPVVDMLRDGCGFAICAVTATGATGDVVRHGRLELSVPKSILVAGLQAALSSRRVHCPPGLAGAADLKKELSAFSFELSEATGRPTYAGRGTHDDRVSALCLSVFGAERHGFSSGADFARAVKEGQTDEARGAARERRVSRWRARDSLADSTVGLTDAWAISAEGGIEKHDGAD